MSDLIDRKKALDEISKIDTSIIPSGWVKGYVDETIKETQRIIRTIPSAEPEMKWIPVTEALPEEEKEVLVSVHFDGYKDEYINYPPSDYVEIAEHTDGVWSSIYDDFKTMRRLHHIVAWMEKPKSYRGE